MSAPSHATASTMSARPPGLFFFGLDGPVLATTMGDHRKACADEKERPRFGNRGAGIASAGVAATGAPAAVAPRVPAPGAPASRLAATALGTAVGSFGDGRADRGGVLALVPGNGVAAGLREWRDRLGVVAGCQRKEQGGDQEASDKRVHGTRVVSVLVRPGSGVDPRTPGSFPSRERRDRLLWSDTQGRCQSRFENLGQKPEEMQIAGGTLCGPWKGRPWIFD